MSPAYCSRSAVSFYTVLFGGRKLQEGGVGLGKHKPIAEHMPSLGNPGALPRRAAPVSRLGGWAEQTAAADQAGRCNTKQQNKPSRIHAISVCAVLIACPLKGPRATLYPAVDSGFQHLPIDEQSSNQFVLAAAVLKVASRELSSTGEATGGAYLLLCGRECGSCTQQPRLHFCQNSRPSGPFL